MNIDMISVPALSPENAHVFAAAWLPAWTGNDPEGLAAWYSDDCFYRDDGIPQGASGKEALLLWFRKLLADNPDWIWTHTGSIPMQDGFVNKWHARIPVGNQIIPVDGICLVQLDAQGKIKRNEVYFDRFPLVAAIQKHRKAS